MIFYAKETTVVGKSKNGASTIHTFSHKKERDSFVAKKRRFENKMQNVLITRESLSAKEGQAACEDMGRGCIIRHSFVED